MTVSGVVPRNMQMPFADANSWQAANTNATSFASLLAEATQSPTARTSYAVAKTATSATSNELMLETSRGRQSIDPDWYFNPKPGTFNLDTMPLLAPSPDNIAAVSQDASARLGQLLAENGIPEAPTSIDFDQMGQIVLPSDYEYAVKFREAIQRDPVLGRELGFIHASAEFQVNVQESIKYQREFWAAGTDAERNAVNARYSYLFRNGTPRKAVALMLDRGGVITPVSGGKLYTDYLVS